MRTNIFDRTNPMQVHSLRPFKSQHSACVLLPLVVFVYLALACDAAISSLEIDTLSRSLEQETHPDTFIKIPGRSLLRNAFTPICIDLQDDETFDIVSVQIKTEGHVLEEHEIQIEYGYGCVLMAGEYPTNVTYVRLIFSLDLIPDIRLPVEDISCTYNLKQIVDKVDNNSLPLNLNGTICIDETVHLPDRPIHIMPDSLVFYSNEGNVVGPPSSQLHFTCSGTSPCLVTVPNNSSIQQHVPLLTAKGSSHLIANTWLALAHVNTDEFDTIQLQDDARVSIAYSHIVTQNVSNLFHAVQSRLQFNGLHIATMGDIPQIQLNTSFFQVEDTRWQHTISYNSLNDSSFCPIQIEGVKSQYVPSSISHSVFRGQTGCWFSLKDNAKLNFAHSAVEKNGTSLNGVILSDVSSVAYGVLEIEIKDLPRQNRFLHAASTLDLPTQNRSLRATSTLEEQGVFILTHIRKFFKGDSLPPRAYGPRTRWPSDRLYPDCAVGRVETHTLAHGSYNSMQNLKGFHQPSILRVPNSVQAQKLQKNDYVRLTRMQLIHPSIAKHLGSFMCSKWKTSRDALSRIAGIVITNSFKSPALTNRLHIARDVALGFEYLHVCAPIRGCTHFDVGQRFDLADKEPVFYKNVIVDPVQGHATMIDIDGFVIEPFSRESCPSAQRNQVAGLGYLLWRLRDDQIPAIRETQLLGPRHCAATSPDCALAVKALDRAQNEEMTVHDFITEIDKILVQLSAKRSTTHKNI